MDLLTASTSLSGIIVALSIILIIVLEILFLRFLFRKLNISLSGGMPKSVWKVAGKNLATTSIVLIGSLLLFSLIFIKVFNQSTSNAIAYSAGIYFGLYLAFLLKKWAEGRNQRGRLVLEIAPGPINKNAFFINVPTSILFGFACIYFFHLTGFAQLVSIAIGISMAAFNIAFAMGKLQIYEDGIFSYMYFVRWMEIESYQWVKGNEKYDPLKIRLGKSVPWFMRDGALMIPVEKKEMVVAILLQYLPEKQGETP